MNITVSFAEEYGRKDDHGVEGFSHQHSLSEYDSLQASCGACIAFGVACRRVA